MERDGLSQITFAQDTLLEKRPHDQNQVMGPVRDIVYIVCTNSFLSN